MNKYRVFSVFRAFTIALAAVLVISACTSSATASTVASVVNEEQPTEASTTSEEQPAEANAGSAEEPVTAEPVSEEQPAYTVTVSGDGQVSAQPDMATVMLGVQTEAEEANMALTENSETMAALIAALQEADVADEDIQTRSVQLWPRYSEPQPEGQSELVGYTAANTVEVRVRQLDALGALLDAAVTAGGNTIEGIQFDISDSTEQVDAARELAWENALHKAGQLADLAGAELGAVTMIEESSYSPGPVGRGGGIMETAADVPVMPGSQMVEVNLRVTWQLMQ